MRVNELTDQAMVLPPDERFLLATRLWESLENFISPEIERAWLEESERRWHEIEKGKVRCIPAQEVMQKARERLERRS